MFKSKNIVYADPGKYLIGNHKVGYQFPGELSEFEEKDVDIKVTKNMSDDDLRDAIREKVNASEDEDGEDDEDEDEDDTEEEAPKKKISVEDIRKKLAKK